MSVFDRIMAGAGRHGLPLAAGAASGERHEARPRLDTLKVRFLQQAPAEAYR